MGNKNISLPDEVIAKATEYANHPKRKRNFSAFVRYALELVFAQEQVDPSIDEALKAAIKRWVTCPFEISPRSLYILLNNIAVKYPKDSAKRFWGESHYVGPRDVSNMDLVGEIKRDYEAIIATGRNR